MKTWLITALVNFHAMRGDMADEARDSISSEEVTEAPLNVSFAKPLASGSLQTQVGWLKLALANWLLGPKMGFIFLLQGDPKKMSVSVLKLKSVPKVRFYFPACVLDSEF